MPRGSHLIGCVAATLLSLPLPAGCASEQPPKAFPSAADSVQWLVNIAHVDTDVEFKQQLTDTGQRDDHLAPRALRKLLKGEKTSRCTFSQGIAHESGSIALYWRISNCGIAGDDAVIQQRLSDKLAAMGFRSFPSPDKRYTLGYRRDLAGAEETMLLNRPERWIGARRPVAGTEFVWTVRSTSTAPMPTYAEMKRVMPVFYDRRITEPIYSMFQDDQLTRIECGGTWTKYYQLRVDIARLPKHGQSADALQRQIVDRLTKTGFQQTKRPQHSTWDMFRPGGSRTSMPVLQVKVEEDQSCVCLAIQPD